MEFNHPFPYDLLILVLIRLKYLPVRISLQFSSLSVSRFFDFDADQTIFAENNIEKSMVLISIEVSNSINCIYVSDATITLFLRRI